MAPRVGSFSGHGDQATLAAGVTASTAATGVTDGPTRPVTITVVTNASFFT